MPDILDALVDNLNGGGQAGGGLELPEEPEDEPGGGGSILPAAAKAAGVLAGGKALQGGDQKAVGDIGGRRAVVINEGESGIEQIASAAASIALLGLPVGKITAAVGSKL